MQVVESIKLREVLELVSKPRYVLGTTYTLSLAFFESAIFPEFSRERLKSCLIIADSLGYHNALTEAAALQGAAQDYMIVRAPISGSFHPKVWLVIGDTEAVLLTGSGNLTQAGFMTNAELFDALHFTPDNPPTSELLADLRSFITGLAGMWQREDHQELLCVETLTNIEQALSGLGVATGHESNGVRFLHSFQGPLIEQMPATPDATELYVAAPYFGDSLQGVELLAARYPAAKLYLYPAVHSGQATDIPLAQLNKSHPKARVAPLSAPGKKGAFAHLKLYGLALADHTARLCCTSANCTQAAWQGPNIEAGLLRTVSRSDLARYFVSANDKLPTGRLELNRSQDNTDALHCWAVDTGAGLDLLMSRDHQPRLPLTDLRFTIRAGSAIATCDKNSLFQTGCRAHIPWTAFEGWQRRRKVAICLEFQALDALGKPVRTTCLVENRMLLSADPIHRSAWRGALALLDAEGAPELGDIAAIFSLAGDMFDGNLVRLPEGRILDGPTRPESNEDVEPAGIAIWPPQPDAHELRKKIGSSAHGQLQWFQNILKSLLQSDPLSNNHAQAEQGHVHLPDDEQDDQEKGKHAVAKSTPDKDTLDRAAKTAKRIWDHAFKDYSRLRGKLTTLCPTPDRAPNIWPASIFAFLSTMAVFQAARRLAPDLSLGITADLLCDDFVRAMFNHRRQHEDYCRPKGFRYSSDERFPSLAIDLHLAFKLQPHPDLATVLVALMIDKRLRDPVPNGAASGRNQQLDLICSPQFVPAADTREACRRLWRRYLCDPKRKAVDAAFEKEFDLLFQLGSGGTPA